MISLREELPAQAPSDFAQGITHFFSETGPLSREAGFEYRREQQQMAGAIAETLESEGHLIVEAGTGVGKSLAYLVPAIQFAMANKRRAVVSTHTINLQEQLIQKDIPFAKRATSLEFEAAILKGRQNYLCPRRLSKALDHAEGLFTSEELTELRRIREWAATAREGSISELRITPPADLWSKVCSERSVCTRKTCGRECFFQRAWRKAETADLIVLNHTLFFTLLGAAEEAETPSYIFPRDFAILDEAHTIESIAARHIGFSVSQYALRQSLLRLANPLTKKGLFHLLGTPKLITEVSEALNATERFFSDVQATCNFQKGRECRLREPGLVDGGELLDALGRMAERSADLVEACEDEEHQAELRDVTARIRESRRATLDFLSHAEPEHVYWVEQTGKTSAWHSLHAAPIDLTACLRELLFRDGTTAVFTSATLSVGRDDLAYFRSRVGGDSAKALSIGSPFDYEKQMRVHVVRSMPDPREATYEQALEKWIAHFTEISEARAFVLFTSYRTMSTVAASMAEWFEKKRWKLLVQGNGLSRSHLVEEFRNADRAVLFGTESFWSGVDIAGEALSNVIITRLPFAQPDNPLIEARLEEIQKQGGDPFQSYSLPEAILKLRQGVGRLIRTTKDKGIVVILDSRIVTKPYGRAFLQALPRCPIEVVS